MKLLLAAVIAVLVAPALTQGCGAKSCSQTTDCDNGQACLFEIGSCSAQGQCKSFPDNGGSGCSSASGCGALQELCGCNDDIVATGCGYPDGWASGPSTTGLACFGGGADGGAPDARVDASDASATCAPPAAATTPQDAGGCRPASWVGVDGGDACGAGQYGLRCDDSTGPPESLGCQVAPSAVIQFVYCCACPATGEP